MLKAYIIVVKHVSRSKYHICYDKLYIANTKPHQINENLIQLQPYLPVRC